MKQITSGLDQQRYRYRCAPCVRQTSRPLRDEHDVRMLKMGHPHHKWLSPGRSRMFRRLPRALRYFGRDYFSIYLSARDHSACEGVVNLDRASFCALRCAERASADSADSLCVERAAYALRTYIPTSDAAWPFILHLRRQEHTRTCV